MKVPYVCGPLTDLDSSVRELVKSFYEQIADLSQEVLGVRAFVPHEHYDPVNASHFSPGEVDRAERLQVCQNTSLMLVCPIAPSWGGGIEVEMARQSGVPVVLICERQKLLQKKISRLLRGNPAVRGLIEYDTYAEALATMRELNVFALLIRK